MQSDDGGPVYLRLSTRRIEQPGREMTAGLATEVINGGYWLVEADRGAELALVCTGVVAPEALGACQQIREDISGVGLLVVTSPDRLHAGWLAANRNRSNHTRTDASHVEKLLTRLSPAAALVSVCDGHPLSLSWLGSVIGHRVFALGVDRFGQSGDLPDLHAEYRIDSEAILDAAARVLLQRLKASCGNPSA